MPPTDTSSTSAAQPKPDRLEHFPVPFFAVVMGLSGLTLALHAVEATAGLRPVASSVMFVIAAAAFAVIAATYASKLMRHPEAVLAEWRHPVKLAFFPAISISLLLIATALLPSFPELARAVWIVGAMSQAILTLAVLSNWIGHRSFQTIHISPAWFIPAVGNVVAPVAGVPLGFVELSWIFFSAGLIFWLILLSLVMNRLVFHDPLPGRMVPTLAILIAPPAVAALAWLQLNGGVLDPFARLLHGASVVFLALALTQARLLLSQPFALSWWAISFPLAAFAIATLRVGSLSGSAIHVYAGHATVACLAVIVAALGWRTGQAILRQEICRPD